MTEDDRRRNYSRKFGVCGMVSFMFYLLLVILCAAAISTRSCDDVHALELGVCMPCDKLCLDCKEDSTKCQKCKVGYYPSS